MFAENINTKDTYSPLLKETHLNTSPITTPTSSSSNSSVTSLSTTFSLEQSTFIQNIKKWVMLDSQIKLIGDKTKQLRQMKSNLTESILSYIQNNKKPDKIEITDGELRFYDKKEYSPLTFSYVEKCLDEIIPNKEHVQYIIKYIKTHREVKTSMDVRRIYK